MTVRAGAALWVAVAIAIGAAAACGDNLRPETHGVRSGARLKATFFVAGNTRLFAGFHDTELGFRCRFETLPGEERAVCMPVTASITATEFHDDRCTLPVVYAGPAPATAPPRIARVGSDQCATPEMWHLGDPVELPAIYTRTELGGCAWRQASPVERWYPATGSLRLEELAGGEVHREERGRTLHVRYVDGDDGAREPIGMFDDRMGVACEFTDEVAFGARVDLGCYPELCASGAPEWGDETCRPLVILFDDMGLGQPSRCSCSARRFALVAPADPFANPGTTEIREVGVLVPPPVEYYYATEESCALSGYGSTPAMTTLDAVEPFRALRTSREGGDRLEPIELVADGTSSVEPWLRDRELALDCQAHRASDGSLRCLPTGISDVTSNFWADDQCTEPVRVAIASGRLLEGPTRWAIVDDGRRTVYQLGTELFPGNIFTGGPDIGCIAHFWNRPSQRIYVVGPEAVPDRFAPLTEIIE